MSRNKLAFTFKYAYPDNPVSEWIEVSCGKVGYHKLFRDLDEAVKEVKKLYGDNVKLVDRITTNVIV